MDKLLTVPEVAHALRTPPGTLRYWAHKGTGPHSFKVGRRRLYREVDVKAWLKERVDEGASSLSGAAS